MLTYALRKQAVREAVGALASVCAVRCAALMLHILPGMLTYTKVCCMLTYFKGVLIYPRYADIYKGVLTYPRYADICSTYSQVC